MVSRLSKLNNIKKAMPVHNPNAANRAAASRTMGLQQAVAASPTGAGPAAAREIGTAMTAQAGQDAVQQAGQAAQTKQQLGQIALSEQDRALKQEALNDRLNFRTDQAGRTLMNQRQLADFVKANVKDEQEYAHWAQTAQHNSDLHLLALETAEKALQQQLKTMSSRKLNAYEQKQMIELTNYLGDLQEARAKAAAAQQKRGALGGMIGTVAGGVAGSLIAGPAGAAVGAQFGGQGGAYIGSRM